MSDEQRSDEASGEDPPEPDESHEDNASEHDEGTQDASDAQSKAKDAEEEREDAKQEMKDLEENPPEKLEDWPTGPAKYETFGGPEGEHSYEEGPEAKLGPSSLRHHEGGEVTIEGEKVDDADEYKGEPIPGGPTDPDSPEAKGEAAEDEDSDEEKGSDDDAEKGSSDQ